MEMLISAVLVMVMFSTKLLCLGTDVAVEMLITAVLVIVVFATNCCCVQELLLLLRC